MRAWEGFTQRPEYRDRQQHITDVAQFNDEYFFYTIEFMHWV
jgi:hypothetical protein